MQWFEALILGIVQGLTEFLPVSSSGHLEIFKAILGDNSLPKDSLLMTVVLHAATALSTIIVFRKDIINIFNSIIKLKWNDETKLVVNIVISMIPAVFVGLFFEKEIEELFGDQLLLVGFMLLITAALLFFADKSKTSDKKVGKLNAFIIGISQAVAIIPGISRSGATISTSVLLKIEREKAARFSFLMVIPLILGKMAKDLLSGEIDYSSAQMFPLSIGFISSFIVGLFACTWMIKVVKRSKLTWFSIYCIIIGLIAISYKLFF